MLTRLLALLLSIAVLPATVAAQQTVFVVGHSNTIPEIAKALGVSTPIPIADADYDNLFVLSMANDGPPALLQLHYR